MYYVIRFVAVGIVASISGTYASPLPGPGVEIQCNDVTKGLYPSCWAGLNMTGWLSHWQITTPGVNGPAVPGAAGCLATESWSTCFLRLGLGKSGENCTKISAQRCVAPQAGAAPQTPQIFYGVYNIYAVNNYFSTAYSVIQNLGQSNQAAIGSAAYSVNGIAYDFNDGKTYPIDTVLVALLDRETNGQRLPGDINTPLINYLANDLSATQYGQDDGIDQIVSLTLGRLTDVLNHFMTNLTDFVSLTQNGAYSTSSLPTLAALEKGFNQYDHSQYAQ